MTYTNPRRQAVIENWPYGAQRTTATFQIEAKPNKGERATRTTINPKTGRPGAAKVTTFAHRVRIVDGEDERTYLLEDNWTHVTVIRSDMQHHQESIWPTDERFIALMGLFDA